MEKCDKFDEDPEFQKTLMEDSKKIMEEVLRRVDDSAKKYGTAYTLADISTEFDEELLDIVGWPLLLMVRLRQIMQKRLPEINNQYLEKFLKYHDNEYLLYLRDQINLELQERISSE